MAATITILEESGESGFRIETLMERTGIAKSSLYMAFGSRDGLIAAARARQFEAMIRESIGPIRVIAERATSRDELRADLRQIIESCQQRGFVTRKHPARMIGNVIQAVVLGRVIVGFDLEAGPDELARWTDMVNDFFDQVLFTD